MPWTAAGGVGTRAVRLRTGQRIVLRHYHAMISLQALKAAAFQIIRQTQTLAGKQLSGAAVELEDKTQKEAKLITSSSSGRRSWRNIRGAFDP
jgi:hypothetical protein